MAVRGPFMRGMRAPEKSKRGLKGNLKEILTYSKKLKAPFIIALILAVIGTILTIIGPSQIKRITDLITSSLYAKIDLNAIASIAIVLLIIYLGSWLATYLEHYIMATVTLDLSKTLRGDLSKKINLVPMSYFNTTSQGDILSRITNDVSMLQQTLSNALPSMVSACAQFAGCLIMMYVSDWRLATAAVVVTILGFIAMALIMKKSQKHFIDRQISLGNLNGYVEEMYSGHDVVRISRAEDAVKSRFKGLNEKVYEANWKSQFLSGIMQPLMTVIGNLGYVAVCVLGSILALSGEITIGTIVAFIMYVRLFTSPLSQIAQGMTNLQSAAAAGDRVFDFLAAPEMPAEDGKQGLPEKIKGEVTFDHVRFAYPDEPDKIIIPDFSAHVLPGEKVAIVGPTGAGKTTMVNLLMRFYELNSGEILIDGAPLASYTREAVHSMFSMVLQDTWTFEASIRDNLVYDRKGITDDDVMKACQACGIAHFVETLPEGLDTILGEEVNISAGQKQLVTIARAMIKNSPMLILDEATSSVDTRTELITQRAMDALMKNRTSFVIAHRLSTIKNADLILVMKDGNIIEQGTHEELLSKNGFYADLYNSQFES